MYAKQITAHEASTEQPAFEIYDFSTNSFNYANTFERARRIMRQSYDAKITRLSDNVVLAQTQGEGGAYERTGVQNLVADVAVYEVAVEAPLAYDAPTVPELASWDIDVSEYLVQDIAAKREAEAVTHELVEWIEAGKSVRIERLVRRADAQPQYGVVVCTRPDIEYALVQFAGCERREWFSSAELYVETNEMAASS